VDSVFVSDSIMDFLEAPFGVGVDSVPAWGYPPSEPTPGPGGSVLYAISVQDSATEALYQELAGHGTSVLRLDSSMGLADLTAWMQQGPGGYAALHLYSHGSPGRFQVGGQEITTGNLPASGEDWSSIGSLLAPDGDLLIYGCSVGRGAVGVELVEALASLTSADVAASINPTGGGGSSDWFLETNSGPIEQSHSDLKFDLQWQGTLVLPAILKFVGQAVVGEFIGWGINQIMGGGQSSQQSSGTTTLVFDGQSSDPNAAKPDPIPTGIQPGVAVNSALFIDGNGDLVNIRLSGPGAFKLELAGGQTNHSDALKLELNGVNAESNLSISVTPIEISVNAGSALDTTNGQYNRMFSAGYTTIDQILGNGAGAIGDIELSAAIVHSIDLPGFAVGSIELDTGFATYVDRVNTTTLGNDVNVASPTITVSNVSAPAEMELFDESPTGVGANYYNPVAGLIDLGDIRAASIDRIIVAGSISASTLDVYDDAELSNDLRGDIEVSGRIGSIQAQRSLLSGAIRAGSVGDINLGQIQGSIITRDAAQSLSIKLPSEFRGFISAAGHLNLGFNFDYPDPSNVVPPSEMVYGEISAGGGISGQLADVGDDIYLPNQIFNVLHHTGAARAALGDGFAAALGVTVSNGIADIHINGLGSGRLLSAGDIGDITAYGFAPAMVVEAAAHIGDVESYLVHAQPSAPSTAQPTQTPVPNPLAGMFRAGGNIGNVRSATSVSAELKAGGSIGAITALTGGIDSSLIEAGKSIGNISAHYQALPNTGKIIAKQGSIGSVDLGVGHWGTTLTAATDIGAITLLKGDLMLPAFAAGGSIASITVKGSIQGGSIIAADDIGLIDVTASKGIAIDGVLIQAGSDPGDRITGVSALSHGAALLPAVKPGLQPGPVIASDAIRNSQILAAEIGDVRARSHTGSGLVDTVIHAQRASVDSITGIGQRSGLLRVTAVAEQDLGIQGIEGRAETSGSGIEQSRFNANAGAIGRVTAQGGVAGGHGLVDSTLQAATHLAGIYATSNANQGDAIRALAAYAGSFGTIQATVLGGEGAAPSPMPPPPQRVITGSGIVDSFFRGFTNQPTSSKPGIEAVIVNVASIYGYGINNSQFSVKDSISSLSVAAFNNTAILNSQFSSSRGVIGSIDAKALNRGSAISGSAFTANNGDIGLLGGVTAIAFGTGITDHAFETSTFSSANGIGVIKATAGGGKSIVGSTFMADTDLSGSGSISGVEVLNTGQHLLASSGIDQSRFEASAIGPIEITINDFESGHGIVGSTFTARTATYDGKGNFDNRGTIGSIVIDSISRIGNGIDSSRFFAGAGGSIGAINVDLITRKLKQGAVDAAANASSGKGIYLSTFQASSFDVDQNVWNGRIDSISVKSGRVVPALLPIAGTPPNDQFTAAVAGIDSSYFAALGGIGDITIEAVGSAVFASAFLADADVAGAANLVAGTLLSSLAADVPGRIGNISITSSGRFAVASSLSLFAGAGIGNIRAAANATNIQTAPMPTLPAPTDPLGSLVFGLIRGANNLVPGFIDLAARVLKFNDRFGLAAVVGSVFAALNDDIGSIEIVNPGATGVAALASVFLAKNSYGPVRFDRELGNKDINLSLAANAVLWVAGYDPAAVYPGAVLFAGDRRPGSLPGFIDSADATALATVLVPGISQNTPYRAGSSIPFDVNFGGPVVVTGQPYLELMVNGVSRRATYTSGSDSATLRFTYVVESSDRTVVGVDDFKLPPLVTTDAANSIRFRDSSGAIPAVTLTTIGNPFSLEVDGVEPEVRSTALSGTTAKAGSILELRVTFNEVVNVAGVPRVSLSLGANKRLLTYSKGAGTDTLVFTYTVTASDVRKAPVLTGDLILLRSGAGVRDSITDLAGNSAMLSLNTKVQSLMRVGMGSPQLSAGPRLLSFGPPVIDSHSVGGRVEVTVQFSDAVTVKGKPLLEAWIGTTRLVKLAYVRGSGTDRLTFNYSLTRQDVVAGQEFTLVPKIILPSKTASLRNAQGFQAGVQVFR